MYQALELVESGEAGKEAKGILCVHIQRNKYLDFLEFFLVNGDFPHQIEQVTQELPRFYPDIQSIELVEHGKIDDLLVLELVSDISVDRQAGDAHSTGCWATITEIMQILHVMNSPISTNVVDFFGRHPQFGQLYLEGQLLPSPIIVYECAKNSEEAYFLQTYGKVKRNKSKYYIFTNQTYASCKHQCPKPQWIIRFALLMHTPLFFSQVNEEDIDADVDSLLLFHSPPQPCEYWIRHYSQQLPL